MFSRLIKTLLIISAIAPVGLVYAWVSFRAGKVDWAVGLVVGCSLLIIICVSLLRKARRTLERFTFYPESVEAADRENIAFMLLYLSPIFTSKLGEINLNVIVPTMFIFLLLTATGYSYHFNPLLGLVGWHFYKVSSREGVTYVLITRRELKSTKQITQVGQLTEYILMDLGDYNAD